jgi:hypothetical protein
MAPLRGGFLLRAILGSRRKTKGVEKNESRSRREYSREAVVDGVVVVAKEMRIKERVEVKVSSGRERRYNMLVSANWMQACETNYLAL